MKKIVNEELSAPSVMDDGLYPGSGSMPGDALKPSAAQLADQPNEAVQAQTADVVPAYWADACKHLIKKDRVMKRLIPRFGNACLQSHDDAFSTLARSVVGPESIFNLEQIPFNCSSRRYSSGS